MRSLVLVLLAFCNYAGSTSTPWYYEERLATSAPARRNATLDCDSTKISCANEERCIYISFICDRDDDCDDESDEDSQLCAAWRNEDCLRNEVICHRNGRSSDCVTKTDYCTSDDLSCEGDLDPRICKMLENGILEDLDNIIIPKPPVAPVSKVNKSVEIPNTFSELIPYTLRHINCPTMYTMVGDQCLSIFYIGSMSWGVAREFCKILNGDLITFKNISHYAAVAQHLARYELTSSFWIGGRLRNVSEGWTWVDESPMELGSPYWATRYSSECVQRNVTVTESEEVCYHYYQAPEAEAKGQCASLSFEQFFYMADDDCLKKLSPLCVYQGSDDFRRINFP